MTDREQQPLFRVISGEQFVAKSTPTSRSKHVTEPRNRTVWFKLPTHTGFCTIPDHEEVQRVLKPEQQEYRQKYPSRYVFEIEPGVFICRDCFIAEADK